MLNQDYVVMVIRTIFQMGGVVVALRPDLITPAEFSQLGDTLVAVVGGAFSAAATLHMLWTRFNTKVIVAK
ncbi:MAG TPA: hypothetical protein VKT73_15205 [Xanthobacteraceae bacterium]|nr:hypothetical protein [Xanthobacteraceae bacterium]